ncbi:MAG: prepilin-type N-terminal cleavage/methylation domain-containing protein, partial [Limisphaerales bacterium]
NHTRGFTLPEVVLSIAIAGMMFATASGRST